MDDIQRKLAEIDRQLAGGRDIHKQIFSTCPLLFAAAGLIAGILLQSKVDLPVHFWLTSVIISVIAICCFAFGAIYREGKKHLLHIVGYLTLGCFICLGAIRLTGYRTPPANDICNFVPAERKLATIRGQIITAPFLNEYKSWKFAKFQHTDPASSFYLKLCEVEAADGWAKVSGTIRVHVTEPVLDLKAGDFIQAYCWLDRFKPATNPGQFNIAKYLAQKNVLIGAQIKSRDSIELLSEDTAGVFAKTREKLRETVANALLGYLPPQGQSYGLLQALLLGYRGNIDSATYTAFRKTGLLHLISLSGLHLGILVGILWWICRTMGLSKPGRSVVCIIATIVFLLVVSPRPPILRAAIISLVFFVSFFFRRKSNPVNTLSLAAIILLLIRPTSLFGAGWQLSFASVLGILLFTVRIESFLRGKLTDNLWIEQILKTKLFYRVPPALDSHFLRLFSAGLAAWLASAGILLYHFYTINPLTSVWTVIVFPVVALILMAGFLKTIFAFLLPTLAVMLSYIASGLCDLLIWLVKLIAHLEISEILIGKAPPILIIFYYALVAFIASVYFRRTLIKRAICLAAVLGMVAFIGAVKWQKTNNNDLVLTCLDVGHGQAIFARLPGKANILFDAGSFYKKDVGRRIVNNFLRYSGINRIDSIVISHNDIDHINGIPEVIEDCKVGKIYANRAFFNKTDQWRTAEFLHEVVNEKNMIIEKMGKKLNPDSSAEIKALWPTEQFDNNQLLSDNDLSMVFLIEFAGRKILLCSDIEKFAQNQLLKIYPALKADIVVVPHHGSVNTLEPHFPESLGANTLISSCGRTQYQKYKDFWLKNNAAVFFTAEEGAITVNVGRQGKIKVNTFVPKGKDYE